MVKAGSEFVKAKKSAKRLMLLSVLFKKSWSSNSIIPSIDQSYLAAEIRACILFEATSRRP
jgi:hypothetical protein